MASPEELIARSIPFLEEVKDMTPGVEVEQWLNKKYGEDSHLYQELASLIKTGVAAGWAANIEVQGKHYRRSRLAEPSARTLNFSITAVYMDSNNMDSRDPRPFSGDEDVRRGDFHGHPYGELNLVVPIDKGAMLAGLNGWQGPGWTAPHPGSRHYPEVKGGALIALFYLPAGRISYNFEPPAETADT